METRLRQLGCVLAVLLLGLVVHAQSAASGAVKFYDDDPLVREPETQDASGAQAYDIDLTASLLINLFGMPGRTDQPVRAGNVNTIDDVPDSSWFTNRIYARTITAEEIARGPNTIDGPAPGPWTITGAKTAGAAPGFRMRDAKGEHWFVTLDARGAPNAATGAIAVACRLFWALGYHQVENYLASFRLDDLVVDPKATFEPRVGYERPMRVSDLDSVLARAARRGDGSYRVIAARSVPGRILGGFRYLGTRPDDPNDLVPHEQRRELRALKVFGAWANLIDLKALNTLDTLVPANGRQVIRHYLQDVGSTFGTGANGPHDWDEGHEYLYEGDPLWKRVVSFGFYLRPWQTSPYYEHPEIGRIERTAFVPEQWRPRVPVAPLHQARDDDTFWAALRVSAFTDDLIRAAVREARYDDPAAEAMLATILIERRDAIARAYLTKVAPLVRFTLDVSGALTFENAAVRAGILQPPDGGYGASWSAFDNATQAATPLGSMTSSREERLPAPAEVGRQPRGSYLKVIVTPHDSSRAAWTRPIDVYFRRTDAGWKLVGIDR